MNYFEIIALVASICIVVVSIFLAGAFIFYHKIYFTYKQISQPMSASELFDTLSAVVNTEIDLYEKNIFVTQGNVLSTQNFENYYNTICYQILGDFSDSFFERAKCIMTEEVIGDIVARSVQSYLATKLATGGVDDTKKKEELL